MQDAPLGNKSPIAWPRQPSTAVIPMLPYRIRLARRHAELTRAQLARRLRVETRLVRAWERGTRRPTSGDIADLARVLAPAFGVAHVWLDGPTGRSRPDDKHEMEKDDDGRRRL